MSECLYGLVYRSRAVASFDDAELVELLEAARAKNQRLGITGLLLFSKGAFIQLLEGDERAVMGLYEVLERDPRHAGVTLMMQGAIDARAMSGWSMGFARPSEAELEELPGFSRFLASDPGCDTDASLEEGPSNWGRRLLTLFKRIEGETS